MTQLEKQLPGKAEMDALLSDINQAGLGRGLQFELFRPGAGRDQGLLRRAADLDQGHRPLPRHRLVRRRHRATCRASSPCTTSNITSPQGRVGRPRDGGDRADLPLPRRGRDRGDRKAAAAKAKAEGAGSEEMTRASSALAVGRRCIVALLGARRLRRRRGRAAGNGWSSRSARSSRASSRCPPPKKFNPQPYSALGQVEPFSTQKLAVALKQEARQPNSLAGGRDQPAQGAARGLSAGQHGHGGQRRPRLDARTRC